MEAMTTPSSAAAWFESTNNASGMVTFATVLYMFSTDMWQLDHHPRTWVRFMIYLDAVAFVVSYGGNIANSALPLCSQRNAYNLVADMLWCMKDAIKYGYITFRSMTICGYSPRKISRFSYASASVSIVLYCILMAQVYSFNVQTNCSAYFQSNIPRVSLYLFWTVIDVASAVSIIFKMRKAILETQENLGYSVDSIAFSIVKFREELRLIFVGVSMLPVMIVIIVQTTHPELPTYRVGTMVFIFAQLILVIGSKKVVVQTPSDPDYTDIEKKACTAKKFSDPRLSIEKGQSQSTLDICE